VTYQYSLLRNPYGAQGNLLDIGSGFGAGKAWRVGKNIFNAFVEPQWTVAHKGEGLPQFTVFAGINVTFGK